MPESEKNNVKTLKGQLVKGPPAFKTFYFILYANVLKQDKINKSHSNRDVE